MLKQGIFIVFAALSFLPSQAMERVGQQEKEYPQIIIANDYPYKLKVEYGTPGELVSTTILAGFEKRINRDPQHIKILRVSPSGKYMALTQMREPQNIANEVAARAISNPDHDIEVIVKSSALVSTAAAKIPLIGGILKTAAKKGEEYVAPFEFSYAPKMIIKEEREKSNVPKSRLIIDAFRQAKEAHENGRPILARHFLAVPEGAPLESIDEDYFELKDLWEKEKEKNPSNAQYADKVLQILEAAWKVLRSPMELKKLIEKDVLKGIRYN